MNLLPFPRTFLHSSNFDLINQFNKQIRKKIDEWKITHYAQSKTATEDRGIAVETALH